RRRPGSRSKAVAPSRSRWSLASPRDHFRNRGADAIDIGFGHAGVQRQRYRLARDALCVRILAFASTVAAAEGGEMQRFVRNPRGDAASLQRIAKLLARYGQVVQRKKHAEHVPGMAVFAACVRLRRQYARRFGRELREIAIDQRTASRKKLRQAFALPEADAPAAVGRTELADGKCHSQ